MAGLRRLLVASVAAAGLAGALAHSTGGSALRRRKTMGFGPEIPHATFATGDVTPRYSFQTFDAPEDPVMIARVFAEQLTATLVAPGSDFYVRDDTYTDKNTGVTHVFLRQTLYGVEVADGDLNVNVKNGRVLSYGDSVSYDAIHVNSCPDLS